MGRGDQYMKPAFSVPLGISREAPWPFQKAPPDTMTCPICGQRGSLGRGHYEAIYRSPRRSVCMGLVKEKNAE